MRLSFALALTLAAAPGFSGTGVAPPASIALYTQFQQDLPAEVESALRDELSSIMAPMGLSFEWRPLTGVRGNEVAVELAVLSFKGKCDVSSPTANSSHPGALGWTHVSDGAILPFSDIDCDRIRAIVQKDILSLPQGQREDSFGRALARVVAHELYHIFAKTSRHGSCGVGKAAYSVRELLSDEFQFEERESRALRSSEAAQRLEANPGRKGTP